MSITTNSQQGTSSDASLKELAHALEQLTRGAPASVLKESSPQDEPEASKPQKSGVSERLSWVPGTPQQWSLAGLAALGMGIAVVAWPSSNGAATKVAASTTAIVKSEPAPPPKPQAQPQPVAAAAPPPAPPPAPIVVSIPPEVSQTLQANTLALAKLSQGIEQLNAAQAGLARDNAELAAQLKDAQEKIARDNLGTAEQLKINQDRIAALGEQLKAAQDQIDRLSAPKPAPRPPKVATSAAPLPLATPALNPPKPKPQLAGQPPKPARPAPPKQP